MRSRVDGNGSNRGNENLWVFTKLPLLGSYTPTTRGGSRSRRGDFLRTEQRLFVTSSPRSFGSDLGVEREGRDEAVSRPRGSSVVESGTETYCVGYSVSSYPGGAFHSPGGPGPSGRTVSYYSPGDSSYWSGPSPSSSPKGFGNVHSGPPLPSSRPRRLVERSEFSYLPHLGSLGLSGS